MTCKIYLGSNLFNDIQAVKKCWPHIIPLVDGAIIVDGSYPEFPTPYDISSDGTVDWIWDHMEPLGKDVQIIRFGERKTEIEKRTAYMEYADKYLDWLHLWLLIWDGDFELAPKEGYTMKDVELEFNDLRNNSSANEVFITIDIPYTDQDTKGSIFHLGFRNTPGLEYKHNHFCIYNKAGKEVKSTMPSVDLQKCRILHWHLDKLQSRIDERSYYSSRVVGRYET